MLKNLVWQETNKEKELEKLQKKWSSLWNESDTNDTRGEYFFNNAEQIAKEKAEILNKKVQPICIFIDTMTNAGFIYNDNSGHSLRYVCNGVELSVVFLIGMMYYCITKDIDYEYKMISPHIRFNDPESIEFYYNIFRNILNYESNKLNGVNAGGGH